MIEVVKNFIEKYNLSGTFIVAFSGGYDSMCLLDVMHKLELNTVAVHLNHNWRGEESFNEAKNCENFAKSKGIQYYCEILSDSTAKTETAAREARYDFFKRCAKKFNTDIVFTAHNFDDNAETVLYRIIKGTGTKGLAGICEHRDIFYRPLLTMKREDIEYYCKENNLNPNCDSSNTDTKYKRNFIRHKIIPLLEEINPKVKESLNSLSDIAEEDNKIIDKYLPQNIFSADKSEKKRIIYNILAENDIDYDREKIENILNFIEENKNSKSGKTISVAKDLWLFVNNKKAELVKKEDKCTEVLKVTKEGEYAFGNGIFKLKSVKNYDNKTDFPKDCENKAYVCLDEVNFELRTRRDGDFIAPMGCEGTQKLKKYLNEKKIAKHEKDKIVFLCKGSEVLWAVGHGISDKIKVVNKPTHMLIFEERNGYES